MVELGRMHVNFKPAFVYTHYQCKEFAGSVSNGGLNANEHLCAKGIALLYVGFLVVYQIF